MTTTDPKVYPGIWCPTGEFLCLICHGPNMKHGRSGPMKGWTDQPYEGKTVRHCKCDGCDRQIAQLLDDGELGQATELGYVRDHINRALRAARERTPSDELLGTREAKLEQTGGMCDGSGKPWSQMNIEELADEVLADICKQDPKNQQGPADREFEFDCVAALWSIPEIAEYLPRTKGDEQS